MRTNEHYTTTKKGDDPNYIPETITDVEIEDLMEKTGLNKNGNKCVLRKKLIMEINNRESLSLDESNIMEKGLIDLLDYYKNEKNIETFIV